MRTISIYDAVEDCPHLAEEDQSFQESALFVWHDSVTGSGGFWRIGQEPVAGVLNSCFGAFTADGLRFRSNVTGVPMSAGDRSETHMGWGSALRADLDRLAITASFRDCEARLSFEDFFPRYEWHELVRSPSPSDHARAHFEVAGRMAGCIRIGDREMEVNALGYRDRSWGPRNWGTLRATRWWPAVFGPDCCAHVIAVIDENFQGAYGYAIQDGIPFAMCNIEVLACLDYDALTPRRGYARFTLENGQTGELRHEPADGILMNVRGYTAVESVGVVRWGDLIGMSNLEVSTNPGGGSKPPVAAFGANNIDGLSQR
jgi:hypothetical protein